MKTEIRERMIKLPISTLADAMKGYGTVDTEIKALEDNFLVCGTARTVWVLPGNNGEWLDDFLKHADPGDIAVIDSGGDEYLPGLTRDTYERMMEFGLGGVVIDGAVSQYFGTDLPVFARCVHPRILNKKGAYRIGCPVSIGGAVICDGDTIYGTGDGMICIPREELADVMKLSETIWEQKRK